LLSFIVSII